MEKGWRGHSGRNEHHASIRQRRAHEFMPVAVAARGKAGERRAVARASAHIEAVA